MMRSKLQLGFLVAFICLMISGCKENTTETKSVSTDMSQTKATIQAMEDAYAAAEKSKDADAVAAYYSDDAISYSRNVEPTSGKAAIKERIAKNIAKDTSGNSNVYKVVDLFGDENKLVEIGSWSELDPSGKVVDKGHYMSYFEKRDGKWVCVRDMNVTSMPAKTPAM